ncbi:hypothetical protein LG198_03675 [Methylobacillus arboreus]|uniref:hypothetical protein n=1 Tax=Methylobacillus arboreus TaxID=755170 RepID=UPI001E4220A7|nr:hypothetical protein [Methylobacillus arboreus]MCB5189828.1 hypothetical protein [Methylobacillus arboreus]
MQKMLTDYDTLEGRTCKPYQDENVSFLSIQRLQLNNAPLSLRSHRLLQNILKIFAASVIFTHATDKNYLFIRASIGLPLAETLQYADISNGIYTSGALSIHTDEREHTYIGAPIRNSEGRIVAATTMLRTDKTAWNAEEIAFFRASLQYIEFQVAQADC